MKKIFIIILSLLVVCGCSCQSDRASDAIENYLNDYKGLSDRVLEQIDELALKEEFLNNGVYDATKYLNYKLNLMRTTNETITYNIVFKLINIDSTWQVEQPDEEVLEKIHGIYNYESD